LIGVTAMFIASKYEEIYPTKLKVVHEKIAHKKLSIETIKNKENEILSALDFNINTSNPYDLANMALIKLRINTLLEPKTYTYLTKILLYLSKMVYFDLDISF